MMTKWDTIQLDVADMYIGADELDAWEKAYLEDNDFSDGLTLDWDD